jgi:hypothetical protein
MNSIGFKREPEGAFYVRLGGCCGATQPPFSHSSAILQPRVPKATGQGISIRASAPYRWDTNAKIYYLRNALSSKMEDNLVGCFRSETNTYNRFVQKCVGVSNDMEVYGQWTKKRDAGNSYTAGHTRVPYTGDNA